MNYTKYLLIALAAASCCQMNGMVITTLGLWRTVQSPAVQSKVKELYWHYKVSILTAHDGDRHKLWDREVRLAIDSENIEHFDYLLAAREPQITTQEDRMYYLLESVYFTVKYALETNHRTMAQRISITPDQALALVCTKIGWATAGLALEPLKFLMEDKQGIAITSKEKLAGVIKTLKENNSSMTTYFEQLYQQHFGATSPETPAPATQN